MKAGLSAGLAIWASAPAPPVAAPIEVHHQMNALDRRARIDMILYPGTLSGPSLAPIAIQLGR